MPRVGSSSRSAPGSSPSPPSRPATTMASARRWRSPPERSRGSASVWPSRPKRRRASVPCSPRSSSPTRSWTKRSLGLWGSRATPAGASILPRAARARPAAARSRVLLPAPLLPIRATRSPGSSSSSTPRRASVHSSPSPNSTQRLCEASAIDPPRPRRDRLVGRRVRRAHSAVGQRPHVPRGRSPGPADRPRPATARPGVVSTRSCSSAHGRNSPEDRRRQAPRAPGRAHDRPRPDSARAGARPG